MKRSACPVTQEQTPGARSSLLIAVAAACAVLSACGERRVPRRAADVLRPTIVVSEADMRTARLLSLSNNGSLNAISDPYQQSLACVVSLGWMAEQMRGNPLANAELLRGLDTATKMYRRRALDQGKSQPDLTRDVQERRAGDIDRSEQARLALSCVRQLTSRR